MTEVNHALDVSTMFAGADMIRTAMLAHGLPDAQTVVVNIDTRKIGFLFETTEPLRKWAEQFGVEVERRVTGHVTSPSSSTQIIRHTFQAEMFDCPFYAACTWVVTGSGSVVELRDQL